MAYEEGEGVSETPTLIAYGCWLQPIDFDANYIRQEAYILMGRCSTKCHAIKHIILKDNIELSKFDIIGYYHKAFQSKFNEIHG